MPEYICMMDRVWTGNKLYRKGDVAILKEKDVRKNDPRFMLKAEHEKALEAAEEARLKTLTSGKTDDDLIRENEHLKEQVKKAQEDASKELADLKAELEKLKKAETKEKAPAKKTAPAKGEELTLE